MAWKYGRGWQPSVELSCFLRVDLMSNMVILQAPSIINSIPGAVFLSACGLTCGVKGHLCPA